MAAPPVRALGLPAALSGLAAGILIADQQPGLVMLAPVVGLGTVVVAVGATLLTGRGAAAVVLALGWFVALGLLRGDAARLPTGPDSVTAAIGIGEVVVEGTVADEPRPREDRFQLVLDTVRAGHAAADHALRGRLLAWVPRTAEIRSGDRVRFTASLEEAPILDAFDYRAYLARQGIGAVARSFAVERVGAGANAPGAVLAHLRRTLADGINDLVPEPEAALGVGILLGIRSGIDPLLEERFAAAGLTHVVAISGWNIAIVTALAAAVLRPLRTRPGGRWSEATATVGVVVAYVVLVGGSPSVVRAALMATALLVARLGGSRAHAASALALAALVMLVTAPPLLWDVGFQLSALATGGLLAFAGPINRRLAFLPGLVREPVALTVAAQVATLPVVLGSFERLSLVAPLANVAVVPLVPLVMAACAVAAPFGALLSGHAPSPPVDVATWAVGGLAWMPLRALVAVGSFAGSVPLASIPVAPPIWLPFAWYPLVALVAMRSPRPDETDPLSLGLASIGGHARPADAARWRPPRLRWVAAGVLGLLVVLTMATQPDGRLHIVALDIGQGDAVLVVAPNGTTVLIDGGPDPERTLRELGRALPFHRRTIDLLVLSHPHQDHVAGLVDVLDRYRVRAVLDPGRPFDNATYARFLADVAREPGASAASAEAGGTLSLGDGVALRVLFPTAADRAAALPDGDINNASVVLMVEWGAFGALLTGDAEEPVERLLLERGLVPPVDVLKVGHHGSESSTTPALLDAARPRLALVSCGIDNEYGHPAPVTLDHLSAASVGVLRTDTDGAVEVVTDGRSLEARAAGRTVARLD